MFGSTRRPPEQHDPDEALVREVGAQLRKARIARGEELEDVAENLRIRPTYLYGLEQGDLAVMPGRTYALGFLRSYARYLGYDGDDLMAQIRSSVTGLTGSAHLHERTPLSESRLPKAPILVVALAALAGIYAGWAWVDGRSSAEIDVVTEVPDDLRQPVATPSLELDARQPEATPELAPAIAPAPEPTISPAIAPASEPEDVSGGAAAPAPPRAAPAASPGADLAAAIPPTQSAAPPEAAPDEIVAAEVATPAPGAGEQLQPSPPAVPVEPAPDSAQAALANPEPVSGQSAPGPAMRTAADVLAALAPVADGAAPTLYRTGDAAARVILRARSSAWVHVSSTNNDYLWVKTLQPGDAFVVPDRPDLVLWTGNAGGIEVIVDGAPLPPLGPDAGVVRDVSLQPQALLRRLLPEPAADAAPSP
jgi:cytoskeleton protein RodZ